MIPKDSYPCAVLSKGHAVTERSVVALRRTSCDRSRSDAGAIGF